jgi:two-component system nitrogen regulation response regulator GlnG
MALEIVVMMSETTSSTAASRTVLVVEDTDVYRQVVCMALQRSFPGWEILEAASLGECGRFVGSTKLDVVVTDLSLPDGSGIDLLPSLAPDLAKGLKLIALTNDSSGDVLAGLKRRGYHGFVAKEHGIKALCEGIRAVLAGRDFISQPPNDE